MIENEILNNVGKFNKKYFISSATTILNWPWINLVFKSQQLIFIIHFINIAFKLRLFNFDTKKGWSWKCRLCNPNQSAWNQKLCLWLGLGKNLGFCCDQASYWPLSVCLSLNNTEQGKMLYVYKIDVSELVWW